MRFTWKKIIAVTVTTAVLSLSAAAACPQTTTANSSNPLDSACKTVVCCVQGTCKDVQQYVLSLFGQKNTKAACKTSSCSNAGKTPCGVVSGSTCPSAAAPSQNAGCTSAGTGCKTSALSSTSSHCTSAAASAPASSNPTSSASSQTTSMASSKSASSASSKTATSTVSPSASSSTASTANVSGLSAAEQAVVTLVNQQRAANGLPALTVNNSLTNMARAKSKDMIDNHYFSHQSPTYGSPFDMMKQFDISYTAAGENIAYGQPTAQAVMDAWMNSPGHRANILNRSYTQIGVGAVSDSNGILYWTQDFICP